jgi:hypothetical protein
MGGCVLEMEDERYLDIVPVSLSGFGDENVNRVSI